MIPKHLRDSIAAIEAAGFQVRGFTLGRHIKLRVGKTDHPGTRIVVIPSTPSSWRSTRAAVTACRRELGGAQ